jgi:hypothetical protein
VSLLRAERGAAMVAGLLFAVFLLAMVFYVLGIAEVVLFRERMQDAADTAAFAAAVVHARGMNLIALINLTMAALLAILVGLRLTETLCYVGIALCGALAYPTAGASLSGIGPLTTAASKIHDAAEQLKDPLNQALSLLHSAGEAVAVAVPLGANLRVIDQTVSHYGGLALAIPGRLTLPVEDDRFSVLCEHAGRDAGELAILPISPVLPSSVERKLGDVAGKIVAAGPGWFCGGGGEPPDFNDDSDEALEELPRLPSQEACEAFTSSGRIEPGVDSDEVERLCTRAAVERLASMPARDGTPRTGEPLCPTDCQRSERLRCPPRSVDDCEVSESARLEREGASLLPVDGYEVLFAERAALARAQCRPPSAGGEGGLVGAWWIQQEVERSYVWSHAARGWVEDAAARRSEMARLVQRDGDDRTLPCGQGGAVAEDYALDPRQPACRGSIHCIDGGWAGDTAAPCPRSPPAHGAPFRFRERATEVVHLVRCAHERDVSKVQTPGMDVGSELRSNQEDDEDEVKPFRLEREVFLGGSDFQVRAVVVRDVPDSAEGVLAMARWGQPQPNDAAASTLAALGGIALGQAEYYFDGSELHGQLDDQTDEVDRTEWLWTMSWRARLRPFRLRHAAADAEREQKHEGLDAEQQAYAPPADELPAVDALDCEPLGAACADVRALVDAESAEEE